MAAIRRGDVSHHPARNIPCTLINPVAPAVQPASSVEVEGVDGVLPGVVVGVAAAAGDGVGLEESSESGVV